jgi:hypothetical protein
MAAARGRRTPPVPARAGHQQRTTPALNPTPGEARVRCAPLPRRETAVATPPANSRRTSDGPHDAVPDHHVQTTVAEGDRTMIRDRPAVVARQCTDGEAGPGVQIRTKASVTSSTAVVV